MTDVPAPIATTRIISVSIPASDQERAKQYYCDLLGFDLLIDEQLWPGARLIEVGLPGSEVVLSLLDRDGEIPIGVRMAVPDADAAHRVIKAHDPSVRDEVLRLDFAPPMFEFTDPDGNVLVYLQEV
ncbi:glyoxalase [Mycolicibacterium murale]|uniref:Glyoxalase n=1 Tax=Mycolicibacterium murale TaxID=182220 RepID=A0A7I9WK66_9MYCO|nr:VOC family protein [Mycolicibacterium murale]MCV7183855.1 VOC family protein [Mycolicibacterium murale]GFG57676.1 glyoxalase [Mycolicibacterium murale]